MAPPQHEVAFAIGGLVLLVVVCLLPAWNALSLATDANYVFWAGPSQPLYILFTCGVVVTIYFVGILAFFRLAYYTAHTEQTVMTLVMVILTAFGVSLVWMSRDLIYDADSTYINLMERCEVSDQTHRLYEFAHVLHNIRSGPQCKTRFSVEECVGYEEVFPYTTFLKKLEDDFRCSGFCYPSVANATATTAAPTALLPRSEVTQSRARQRFFGRSGAVLANLGYNSQQQWQQKQEASDEDELRQPEEADEAVQNASDLVPPNLRPPTLFSDANFRTSCEGMAARSMKNLAGDIGWLTCYQGLSLIMAVVLGGFLKLCGFCALKDEVYDVEHHHEAHWLASHPSERLPHASGPAAWSHRAESYHLVG